MQTGKIVTPTSDEQTNKMLVFKIERAKMAVS
jgi:hypothetical protein